MSDISFTQIPSTLRVPGQYFEINNNQGGSAGGAVYKRILVIGQMLSTGTVAANTPTLIQSVLQVAGLTGFGSHLHNVVAALKAANNFTEAWFIAMPDNSAGTAATKTITITGPATGAGTLALYIEGVGIQTGVNSGDAATAIATNVAAAINANKMLPWTATATGAVVTITCKHKGVWGTSSDCRINYYQGDVLPLGVGVTIAAGTAGTANPDITPVIAAMGDQIFSHIVMPYTDSANYTVLAAELERRWSATVMKESVAFLAIGGSLSTVSTWGTTHNEKLCCAMNAGLSPSPTYAWAAAVCGVDAFEPIPNRPRQTLSLPGILAPAAGDEMTLAENNILLFDGVATHMVDAAGNVMIQRLVTNYQLNQWGVPDDSYLDIESIELLITLRFERRSRIAQRFPRCRLASNSSRIAPGSDVITPHDIQNDAFAQALEWIEAGYIADDMPAFKAGYLCEIDANDNSRVNELIPPELIGGLRVFAGLIQFSD